MQDLSCENEFYLQDNEKKNQFQIIGFALSLALKQWRRASRKWPTDDSTINQTTTGFSGSGICLIRKAGFYWDRKFPRDVGCRKQPSGLWDWAKIWVGMTRLSEDLGRDDEIERRFGSGWRDWAKIRVGMTGLKNPIDGPHCSATSVHVLGGWEESSKTLLVCTSCMNRCWEW